jgi:hypothetical protein
MFACSLVFANAFAGAQGITTGSITGTVGDPTGAILPGASVTVTLGSTNVSQKATTNSDGTFAFKNLPIGKYTVKISSPGFSDLQLQNVQVDANRIQSLGLEELQTGAATETVEVSAAKNLLETTESQVTTTFEAQQLTDLPLAGGFDEVTLLIPGVVATHDNNFSNTNGTGFSSNGQRGRSNNFELDGQSNNDNSVGGPQVFFSNDEALSQIQVITNDFSAQYGRNMGSVVNYITQSGTNQIHGSAIYRYSGDFTSSLSTGNSKGPQFGFCAPGENSSDGCLPTVVPRYVDNMYGGTLGGPIIKDKLFAFGSTYFQRFYEFGAVTSSTTALFPTSQGLATLASTYPNNPAVAILQQLSPYNISAGGPRQLTSIPVKNETVSNGTTSVTIPFAAFGRQIPNYSTDQEDMGRLDYQLTPKDRMYLRYFYQKNPTSPYSPVAGGGFVNVRGATHSVGADITHTFSPRWVDQLRYSFQQSVIAFDGGGFSNCTITSFQNCPSSVSPGKLPDGTSSAGIGLSSSFPQGRIVKTGQVQDNANWLFGKHSITFGGEFDYQNSPNTFLPNASGTFTYASFNAFLAGGCTAGCSLSLTAGNPIIPFKEHDVAVYFQDDWKLTPSLTVNLGLRWEFFQQALNFFHSESVAQQTGSNPYWSTALPLSQTTFPSIPQSYRNIEPRFGFAYNPQSLKRLVVRGGYAINVDPGFYNINLNIASSAPIVNAGTIACNLTIQCLPSAGATFPTVTAQDAKYIPTGGNPGDRNQTTVSSNFRQPMAQTFTLGVQYQIRNSAVFEIRYTGDHTSGNFQTLDGNPYLAPVAADFPNFISPASICTTATSTLPDHADVGHLHCGSTNVRVRANTAFSVYNGLQTSLTTRNFHGVTATAAYTFSRTIDNTSEIFGTLGGGNTVAFAQNPLDTNVGERAVSGISFPNVASISMRYQFPDFHSQSGLVGRVLSGWQTNTIWLFNSGQPYNDFDYEINQSPYTNYPDDPNTYESYSDIKEATAFNSGYDFARPILSNPKAPRGTLGLYTDVTTARDANNKPTAFSAPMLVDYATGAPISPSDVRFIANNRMAAKILGNPFPGSGRNILRGDSYNNVDFSVFKNTNLTERITLRLEADAYNVLNRGYYGTPDNFEGDYPAGSFNNFLYSYEGGSLVGPGTGSRNMTFGAKILF